MDLENKDSMIKMKTNKYTYLIGISLVFILLLSSYVMAFGVGSAYHKDHPLELSIGETKEIIFNLQNPVGEDTMVKPSITKGSEILELIDPSDISVPVGASIDVKVKVSIPLNAKIGDIYPVEISFTTITESESGSFGFGSSVGRNFDVIVIPTAEEIAKLAKEVSETKTFSLLIVIAIVILIIIIISIILKKIKTKKH